MLSISNNRVDYNISVDTKLIRSGLLRSRFDDAANKEINKTLVQNVMAVNKDDQVTPCVVKH